MSRQFEPGDYWSNRKAVSRGECKTLFEYEIVKGRKGLGDIIVQFSVDGGPWIIAPLSHLLSLVAPWYQVEENNYGKNGGVVKSGRGGEYLLQRIEHACADLAGALNKTDEEISKARLRNSQQNGLLFDYRRGRDYRL